MERESFEDEEVAETLNKHYVSIKVDRLPPITDENQLAEILKL